MELAGLESNQEMAALLSRAMPARAGGCPREARDSRPPGWTRTGTGKGQASGRMEAEAVGTSCRCKGPRDLQPGQGSHTAPRGPQRASSGTRPGGCGSSNLTELASTLLGRAVRQHPSTRPRPAGSKATSEGQRVGWQVAWDGAASEGARSLGRRVAEEHQFPPVCGGSQTLPLPATHLYNVADP